MCGGGCARVCVLLQCGGSPTRAHPTRARLQMAAASAADQKRQLAEEEAATAALRAHLAERERMAKAQKKVEAAAERKAEAEAREAEGWGSMDLSHAGLHHVPKELYTGEQMWTTWAHLVVLDISHNNIRVGVGGGRGLEACTHAGAVRSCCLRTGCCTRWARCESWTCRTTIWRHCR